jgi:hypothetical protein
MVGQAGISNTGGSTFMAAGVDTGNGVIYGGGSGPKSGGAPLTALNGGTGVVIVEEFY